MKTLSLVLAVAGIFSVGWGLVLQPLSGTEAAAPQAAVETSVEARRLLAEAERVHGPNSREVADALHRLIEVLLSEGTGSDAPSVALAEREVELAGRLAGTDDLLYAAALNDRGRVTFQAGRFGPARGDLERALALREKFLGPDDALVGRSLIPLGLAVLRGGDPSGARPLMERGLDILE